MKKNNLPIRLVFYVLGFAFMTLGIAISKRSGLGVSPVSSLPYAITGITGIGVSITTIIFHSSLVLLQLLILRKEFKIKSLLQIPAGVLFGVFTGAFQKLANMVIPDPAAFSPSVHYTVAVIMCLISTVLIAFGLFLYVPSDIVPLAAEGLTLAVSEKAKIKFSNAKIAFDVTTVAASFIACCVYSHGLKGGIDMAVVGVGTVIAAVLVGVNIKWITKLFGKYRDKYLKKSNPQ